MQLLQRSSLLIIYNERIELYLLRLKEGDNMQLKKWVLIAFVDILATISMIGIFCYRIKTNPQNNEVRNGTEEISDKKNDISIEIDENGMIQDIDAGFLKEMPDDTELTQFDIDLLHEYPCVLEGEKIENVLELSEEDIYFEAVRGLLNKIYTDNNYSDFKIVDVTQDIDINTQKANYIVKYGYDYWSITYYPGKGATGFQDKTGMLAEMYGEQEEDIEWDE